MSNSKKIVLSNFIWRFAERCGAQGITFVVSIILARLLEPEAYGEIALVTVFINILQVFVDSGMANALVQKKNADETDFSTVFYFNLVICSVLYLILFAAAPYIAMFYELPNLTSVIRVLSVVLIISGLKNVQQAFVSKNLLFKRFFFSTLGGTIGAAIVGIVMAYMGFGIWALVAQQLFNTFVDTCILWITVKWRPKRIFSFIRLKELFSFGWKLLLSHLLDTVYKNARSLLIGKFYSAEKLAYYNRGNQLPRLVITNVNSSLDSVLFPVMSEVQDDVVQVKSMTRRVIRVSSYIIWPLMIGLAACADTVVELLLTEKWLPCVPYLRIFCIFYAFWPIHTANLNAIKAMGRSDIFMRLEIIKKTMDVILIITALPFGVRAIALSELVTAPVSALINAAPNKKLLGYGYKEQVGDMLPSMILSLIMGTFVYVLSFMKWNIIVTLIVQILVGISIYVALSHIFKLESYLYIKKLMLDLIGKRRKSD